MCFAALAGTSSGVVLFSPVACVLVLMALSFTPAREVGIVIGACIGAKVLKEPDRRRRMAAALAVATSVTALTLG